MGAMQRRKGATWEREIANLLKPIFGEQVKRGIAQSRFGASEAPDVDGVPGLWVEAKHGKQVNVRAALRQAIGAEDGWYRERANSGVGQVLRRRPVAFCKDQGGFAMAVMRLEDFLKLIEEWHHARTPDSALVPHNGST